MNLLEGRLPKCFSVVHVQCMGVDGTTLEGRHKASLSLVGNIAALVRVLFRKQSCASDPTRIPLLVLFTVNILLNAILVLPAKAFITSSREFNEEGCQCYAACDLGLSLLQIATTTFIALDRYIVTLNPSWKHWRNSKNYGKVFVVFSIVFLLWSTAPMLGYGEYRAHDSGLYCSIDWSQGHMSNSLDETLKEKSHRYIAFLTSTFLLFFLIPVCTSCALYYSIVEQIRNFTSRSEAHDDAFFNSFHCSWAPSNFIPTVCLGSLLITTVPYLPYAIISLNPFNSDTSNLSLIIMPVIISRISTLLSPPLFALRYEEAPVKKRAGSGDAGGKRVVLKIPTSSYQTIAAIAEVPSMSYSLLTPSIPRRKLPQIPDYMLVAAASHA